MSGLLDFLGLLNPSKDYDPSQGLGANFDTGVQNFLTTPGGLIPKMLGGVTGMATGQRTDPAVLLGGSGSDASSSATGGSFGTGMQNFLSTPGGLIPKLLGGVAGMTTGLRTDPASLLRNPTAQNPGSGAAPSAVGGSFNTGVQNFLTTSGGLIPKLLGGMTGLTTGMRTDPESLQSLYAARGYRPGS